MSFLNTSEMIKEFKISKLTLAKKRDELEIPYLKRGKSFYYASLYEKIIEDRKIIKKKCHVISFGNNKGGVAKTTSVINISSILAYYGYKVLMIDMDTQANLSGHFRIMDTQTSIVNALLKEPYKIHNLEHTSYPHGKLDLIANNLSQALDFANFTSKSLETIISSQRDKYDFIILDTPPSILHITPTSLEVSDYGFMLLKPDNPSSTGAVNFLDLIEKSNCKLLGGLLTSHHSKYTANIVNSEIIDDIFKKFDCHICNIKISNSIVFDEIPMMLEHSILTYNPRHKCCNEYIMATDYLLNNILEDMK